MALSIAAVVIFVERLVAAPSATVWLAHCESTTATYICASKTNRKCNTEFNSDSKKCKVHVPQSKTAWYPFAPFWDCWPITFISNHYSIRTQSTKLLTLSNIHGTHTQCLLEIERTDRCCSETESVTAQICSGRNRTETNHTNHTQICTSRRRSPWRLASWSLARHGDN